EILDVCVDVLDDPRGAGGRVAVVFLGRQHADELAAAVVEFAKFLEFLRLQRSYGKLDDFGEVGENGGVDCIGFGELADAFSKIAYLSGVGNDGGQLCGQEGGDGGLVIEPGGFEDNPHGAGGRGPGDEFVDAGRGVSEAAARLCGPQVGVESVF